MNKRIKELAEQATSSDGWLFDKDKFAELIVRECSKICKESGDVPAVLVSEDILLHFGVEE
jgi:hypothetical protein